MNRALEFPSIFLLTLAVFLFGQGPSSSTPIDISKMTSDDLSRFPGQIEEQTRQFTAQINTILHTARETDNKDVLRVRLCLQVVASMRAENAIPTLLERIEFLPQAPGGGASGFSKSHYPMMEGLAEIGMPSVKAIRPLLDTEESQFRVALMAEVIRGVMGTNPAITQVQDWLNALDPPGRTNSREGKSMNYMLGRLQSKDPPERIDPRLQPAKN